ncbi:hypothetical protein RFI_24615, partial [Reticulomyxa filosa]
LRNKVCFFFSLKKNKILHFVDILIGVKIKQFGKFLFFLFFYFFYFFRDCMKKGWGKNSLGEKNNVKKFYLRKRKKIKKMTKFEKRMGKLKNEKILKVKKKNTKIQNKKKSGNCDKMLNYYITIEQITTNGKLKVATRWREIHIARINERSRTRVATETFEKIILVYKYQRTIVGIAKIKNDVELRSTGDKKQSKLSRHGNGSHSYVRWLNGSLDLPRKKNVEVLQSGGE